MTSVFRAIYFRAIVFMACGLVGTYSRASETIEFIDTYGLRTVSREAVLDAADIEPGDSVPTTTEEIVRGLEALPGVARAAVSVVRAPALPPNGETIVILYLGIDEAPDPRPVYKAAPISAVMLPKVLVATYEEFERSLKASMKRGDYGEDDSKGYALIGDAASQAIQRQFVPLADKYFDRLAEVLQTAKSERQRAIAAWVIAYSADKRRVASELATAATRDPDNSVRNNAMRGLVIILEYARHHHELKIDMPSQDFIDILDSVKWTDRNKAMAVLNTLIEVGDESVVDKLRERSLPGLAEMARWQYEGHAMQPFFILSKVAGLTHQEMIDAWRTGKREEIIERALGCATAKNPRCGNGKGT